MKPEFVEVFARHAWPGNVRELLHALERALLLAEGDALDAATAHAAIAAGSLDAPGRLAYALAPGGLAYTLAPGGPAYTLAPVRSAAPAPGAPAGERDRIAGVLQETGGNVSRAARRLGIARSTLRWQVHRHGLQAMIPED